MSARCNSCPAEIVWLVHADTGKRAPIDIDPVSGGNVEVDLDAGTYQVLSACERRFTEGPLHTNHFATCPAAKEWKGHRRG